jgi:hypothetical protein
LERLGQLGLIEEEGPNNRAKIVFEGEGIYIRNNIKGYVYPIKVMIVIVTYEVKHEFSLFKLYKYSKHSEAGLSTQIADAAVARIKIGDIERDFVTVHTPDLGLKVMLFPPE